MSKREVRVPYDELADPQTITAKNRQMFREHGLDVARDECDIEDDHDRQERVYALQTRRKYIFMSR